MVGKVKINKKWVFTHQIKMYEMKETLRFLLKVALLTVVALGVAWLTK
jgi:putative flippase GtrA